MIIAAISDQHGSLPSIPPCDLLIVSGDICGGPDYIDGRWRPNLSDEKWMQWLLNEWLLWTAAAPKTVFIGGNHDTPLDGHGYRWPSNGTEWSHHGRHVTRHYSRYVYLCDGETQLDNGLTVWGAPWIRQFDNLAFNLPESELAKKWQMIPDNVDILVLHMPPYGYGDSIHDGRSLGSPSLTDAIERIKPKLVTCGHIHEGRGEYKLCNTKIVNTAGRFTVLDV